MFRNYEYRWTHFFVTVIVISSAIIGCDSGNFSSKSGVDVSSFGEYVFGYVVPLSSLMVTVTDVMFSKSFGVNGVLRTPILGFDGWSREKNRRGNVVSIDIF